MSDSLISCLFLINNNSKHFLVYIYICVYIYIYYIVYIYIHILYSVYIYILLVYVGFHGNTLGVRTTATMHWRASWKGRDSSRGFLPIVQCSPSESRQFFTQDDAEIDEAVSRLLEAEPPEQPHRSLAPVTLATELKDLKDLKESAHPNRPSVGETGALDSLDACLHIFVHYFSWCQ